MEAGIGPATGAALARAFAREGVGLGLLSRREPFRAADTLIAPDSIASAILACMHQPKSIFGPMWRVSEPRPLIDVTVIRQLD